MPRLPTKFKFIDLFAGLGGFHAGLTALGGRCVFASEWDPILQQTYQKNFGITPAGDITTIRAQAIPDHNMLAAGFPCQPFSKAGLQEGLNCTKQGQLILNVVDILRTKKPDFFILENVPNLLTHDQGRTWHLIQSLLTNKSNGAGYEIAYKLLSPREFNVPHNRQRLFIVGSRKSLTNFKWPTPVPLTKSLADLYDESLHPMAKVPQRQIEVIEVWTQFFERVPRDVTLPSFPLWTMEWGANYPCQFETPHGHSRKYGVGSLDAFMGSFGQPLIAFKGKKGKFLALPQYARSEQTRFPYWKTKYILQNRHFYEQNKKWINPWLKTIQRFDPSYQKLEWNIHGSTPTFSGNLIQFRASGIRVSRAQVAPSLVTMTSHIPIDGTTMTRLSPLECARLQGLDTLKHLPSEVENVYKALGNAVNADVVRLVAKQLLSL